MFRFILRKMMSKRWMILALLVGNILLIAITSSNAMYGQAVLQRTLTQNLENYMVEKNAYPGMAVVWLPAMNSRNGATEEIVQVAGEMPEAFGVPLADRANHYSVGPSNAVDGLQRDIGVPASLSLGSLNDLPDHIELVAGEIYTETPAEDGAFDVMVSERGMIDMNLILGQRVEFPQYKLADTGEPLKVRVVGVFRNSADDDPYWVRSPSAFAKEMLLPESIFQKLFVEDRIGQGVTVQLYVLLDYKAMRGDQAQSILNTARIYQEKSNSGSWAISYRDNFSGVMEDFLVTSKKVNVTLWVLQVPIFVLLAAFIFMVSRQMLDMEQNEIAVIKSRGASRGQIIITYLLQSTVVAAAAMIIGIPLGVLLVQVLGSANAFLEFVRRASLPVELSWKVLLFALAAALISVAAMVLPVFRHSNVTIVNHKQKKHRKSDAPLWQRMYFDVAILAVSLYGLYAYSGQKDVLAQRVVDGASLDPLLFLSSSLFMIGAGLVALRLLPAITYLVFRLFRKQWSPALYAAFLRVIRTRHSQNFIMVFLVMTLAMGIFNAQAARTINTNEEENISYNIGADLVLQESWDNNSVAVMEAASNGIKIDLVYREPDFGVYQGMEGVESLTKVLVDHSISMSVPSGKLQNVHLMGIHTKTFGETAWFKNGLLPHHFNEYLNAMASDGRAVLLSGNFRENYGYKLGDAIYYRSGDNALTRGVIYGFVDYWPTYSRYSYVLGKDGMSKQEENYLIVANLAQLQAAWGITPYQVWIDAEDSTSFFYDYAQENHLSFSVFEDTPSRIVALKNDPVFQGTNGILTVGFIAVLLLCTVGFLIYWILSIQSRALQFGIYRAMGMSMPEIISMLLCEQLFISATSILTGIGVGVLTSRLYMPLIQMAYAAYDTALPLKVVSAPADMVRITVIVTLMILGCMAILGWLISKMKIAQVLKLGED